ncbi:hypothetical protein E9549_06390 [Blastococcus sp. MG754426]|uniref:hypothetical protein n=1 Tax=unclassified Blastococcus TaxID=2619396 RepID=UPI001EEFB4B1|nr:MULTISPECIES: hypothetical protein [unclassified Blastococcus]MCF6507033.1 hypothetical protein [Blastococcus sp. MG754426]MCF6511698.1 hypothetical protein [Blastococcus sp. MG754427]
MSGIAVVDQPVEDRVVVWHVSVGDGLESTMAGAWVLPADDDRIDGLIAGRLLVITEAAAGRFGVRADAAALAAAVRSEVDALDRAFTAHLATLPSSRRQLVRPRWPRVPTTATPVTAGDPVASGALTVARWVSDVLIAWGKTEGLRLARPFLLQHGGEAPRAYPPGWPQDGAATPGAAV